MWKWSDLKRLLKEGRGGSDHSNGAIITWPVFYPNPQDPSGGTAYVPEDPHVTILYIPDINNPELGFNKQDVLDAIKETEWDVSLRLKATALEWFGPEQNIPVIRVEHTYLHGYRDAVKAALASRGIVVEETYPEYKPHVSTTDTAALDGIWPNTFMTSPVELWWGDEHYRLPDTGLPVRVGL